MVCNGFNSHKLAKHSSLQVQNTRRDPKLSFLTICTWNNESSSLLFLSRSKTNISLIVPFKPKKHFFFVKTLTKIAPHTESK
jgi:hypothetical protein